MADKKNPLKDFTIQFLRGLLGEEKPPEAPKAAPEPRFEDLKEEDLTREILRLEIEERKVRERLQEVEDKKAELFEETVHSPGEVVAEVNWRKTQELEAEAQNYQHVLEVISKRRRIINGLKQLKVRARMLQSPVFESAPLTALIPYIEKATESGELGETEMDAVINALESNYSPGKKKAAEDPAKAAWLRAVQEARLKSIGAPETADKNLSDLGKVQEKEPQAE
jgi:hypothetical protein